MIKVTRKLTRNQRKSFIMCDKRKIVYITTDMQGNVSKNPTVYPNFNVWAGRQRKLVNNPYYGVENYKSVQIHIDGEIVCFKNKKLFQWKYDRENHLLHYDEWPKIEVEIESEKLEGMLLSNDKEMKNLGLKTLLQKIK